MNRFINMLACSRCLKGEFGNHVLRASMVIIFILFGYQKWFEYEAQTLIPFIRNGPLTSWMHPVFGIQGASYFLGVSEWLTAALLVWGFWNKAAGVFGALLSVGTFVTTLSIIPFMPDGWNEAAGFPAMQGNVAFLMKDLVLLAASVSLLQQDARSQNITDQGAAITVASANVSEAAWGSGNSRRGPSIP
jgi:uncharacterized membrane protein YkgB